MGVDVVILVGIGVGVGVVTGGVLPDSPARAPMIIITIRITTTPMIIFFNGKGFFAEVLLLFIFLTFFLI